jgi:hypothetical protein
LNAKGWSTVATTAWRTIGSTIGQRRQGDFCESPVSGIDTRTGTDAGLGAGTDTRGQ